MKTVNNYSSKLLLVMIILMIIVTFSSCDKPKDKPQEASTNTISDTTTSTTNSSKEETTEATTETVSETTTETSTETVETTTETTTETVETTTTAPAPDDYKRLKDNLKQELNKKSFNKEINLLFYDTLDALYKNYPTWKHGYRDLPDTEEYITENLINVVKNVGNAVFYDKDSPEGKKLLDDGSALGWVQVESNGELTLCVICYTSELGKRTGERKDDIERFFHEIIHCKQKKILWNYDYFNNNETFFDLFIEAGTTFHQKFTVPFSLMEGGAWMVTNDNEEISINYTKDNCTGYLINLNAYEKLIYLVGYDIIDGMEKGEIPFSSLRNTLAKNYGIVQGNNFYYLMEKWYKEYLNDWSSDETFNLSIQLENMFFEFIRQDIKALSTKEEAIAYKPIYDFYMQRNLPIIRVEDTYENITKDYFDTSELDEMLNEKLK